MAEVQRPSATIPITLDRERQLRLDLWAGFQAEQKLKEMLGREISLINEFTNDRLSLTHLVVLMWAALRHEDPELTVEQAGRLVTMGDLLTVRDAVVQSWNAHYVGDAPAASGTSNGGAPDPFPTSTGPVSGAGDATTSDSATPSSGPSPLSN